MGANIVVNLMSTTLMGRGEIPYGGHDFGRVAPRTGYDGYGRGYQGANFLGHLVGNNFSNLSLSLSMLGGSLYGSLFRPHTYYGDTTNYSAIGQRPGIGRYAGRDYYGHSYMDDRGYSDGRSNMGYFQQSPRQSYPAENYAPVARDSYQQSPIYDRQREERNDSKGIDSEQLLITDDYTFDLDGNELERKDPVTDPHSRASVANRYADSLPGAGVPLFPNAPSMGNSFNQVASGVNKGEMDRSRDLGIDLDVERPMQRTPSPRAP